MAGRARVGQSVFAAAIRRRERNGAFDPSKRGRKASDCAQIVSACSLTRGQALDV
jgi:hypothetical protein